MRTAGVILALAGLSGAAGMVIAAMTAHGTPPAGASALTDAAAGGRLLDAALRYHLLHAVALAALAGVVAAADARGGACMARGWPWAVAAAWVGGTLFFSGGLYLRAFGGLVSLGPVVPAGGALYILGWGLVAAFGVALALRARLG